jgi:hypothetical protein
LSLIDEALKRARLDTARAEPQERRGHYPWVSGHAAQAAATRRSRRALWAGVLAGSLGAALIGGAGLWLTTRHGAAAAAPAAAATAVSLSAASALAGRGSADSAAEEASARERKAARAAARAALEAQPASPDRRPAAREGASAASAAAGDGQVRASRAGRAAPSSQPVQPSQAAPPTRVSVSRDESGGAGHSTALDRRAAAAPSLPTAASPALAPPPARGGPDPAVPGDAAAAAASGLTDGRAYSREVSLPGGGKLALSGIAYSEHQPVAVINGKVVGPGEVVSEFTVARILTDRVELRGHGVSIFLRLD